MKSAKQNTIVFYLVIVVQSNGLEVLQFSQIPQFQGAILGTYTQLRVNIYQQTVSDILCLLAVVLTCGQIVSILRESNRGDGSRVAWEVGHICTLLQIPDLDLRISSPGAKNETIGVELSTSESCGCRQKH